jgi:hypothetical protein
VQRTPFSLAPAALWLVVSGAATLAACSGNGSGNEDTTRGGDAGSTPSVTNADASTAVPFQAVPPAVYVAKVKNILVGLPPTDAEVKTVEANPAGLKNLIDGWVTLPQYEQKMLRFFQLAFQQTQVSITDFADQTYPRQADINPSTQALLTGNATESFARTMLALNAAKHPFTEALTTSTLMMTPALMEFYAYLDAWQVDDAGKVTDRLRASKPDLTVTVEASQGPIPIADTLDPSNPNYMHWYDPDVGHAAALTAGGCTQDPITYSKAGADTLHYLMYGGLLADKGTSCGQYGGTAMAPQLTAADFSTWKMVTIRTPAKGESPTAFYDLARLRSSDELVLSVPRVGFFTTPAFFANWQTNTSNQMRVTMNQTLIVATGAMVDGTDTTHPATTPGLDSAHAGAGACFGCHQTLDPTRSILASAYSWNYHEQTDATFSGQKGLFAFQGVIEPVSGVVELGTLLSFHPLFAQAWAQKLCYYANSSPCDVNDPEFVRVVGVFKNAGYSWEVLVRELLSSPLTTNASPTRTSLEQGEIIAVSRRDHLCAALNARLGFTDICALDPTTPRSAVRTTIPEIVSGLPSDGYGRGAVAPVLPNQPTLFYRAGTENICEAAAGLVIDVATKSQTAGVKQWSSTQPDAAIADFVQDLMALTPSDSRSEPAQKLLKAHFTAAVQSGASATAALQSTFVAACLAPSAVAIGM